MADDAIDSAEIADGAIDLAHMSANSIDSSQYVDGSIDTIHIADDQITADKLANTAVTAASYGSSTAIPVVTIDAQGRVTAASTAAISSSLTVGADSGSDDVVTVGTDTLDFVGTANEIETTVSNNQIQIGLPNNVTIAGNLTVSGDTTTVNTATLAVEDPLVSLATGNNSADAVDIGLYGLYDTSGSQDLYGGLFRDASDSGKWKLFKDNQAAPTTTVNTSGTGYATGTLVANLEGNVTGNVTGNTSGTAATVTGGTQAAITSAANLVTVGTIGTGVWQGTAIAGGYIANDTIDSQHYAAASIDNEHLADDAVDSDEIAAGAIDLAHMSANSVDSAQYVDGSIDAEHLAPAQTSITSVGTLSSLAVSGNQTIGGTLGVTGVISPTTHIDMPDSAKILLGTSDDLEIYHDGSNSYIKDTGTGSLVLASGGLFIQNAAANENMIRAVEDGAVTLYYDNAAKLDTVSGGIDVTGQLAVKSGSSAYSAQISRYDEDDGLFLHSAAQSSHYNWIIQTQENVHKGFEIVPSASTGARDFTTPALVILADTGNVGIGTSSPDGKLSVTSTGAASEDVLYLKSGADNTNEYLGIAFETAIGGNGPHAAIRAYNGPSSANDAYLSLLTTTDGGTLTQGLVQDHLGRVLIGITESDFHNNNFQIEGTSATNSSMSLFRNSANAVGPYINFGKSRGASVNSDTVVQDDDNLGSIMFYAADGTDRNSSSAYITAAIDGTPGSNDTPGRLVFGTTADGGSGATERMRISSNGNVTFDSFAYDAAADQLSVNNGGLVLTSGYVRSGVADMRLGTASSGVQFTIADSGGNIGIGTGSPGRTLHVYKAGDGQTPVRFSTGNSNSNLEFYNDSGGWELRSDENFRIATRRSGQGNGEIIFYTNSSTERFRIAADGGIGIGGANYGTDGQVLTSTGSGTPPAWEDASGGGGGGGVTGKVEGTNFTNSMIVGHTTTGTLSNAHYNTAVGIGAMDAITSGDENTMYGYSAGSKITSGSQNHGFGSMALYETTTQANNSAFGENALMNNAAADNSAFGAYALDANTTGSGNVAVGKNALGANVAGGNITAVGTNAMHHFAASGDNRNTAIGHGALYTFNGNPGFCTAVGEYAGYSLSGTSVGYNTFIGAHAGYQLGADSQSNTAVGARAMQGGAGGGTGNTAVGMDAAYSITSADYVTAVGNNAVNANQTNHYLTGIGYNSLRYVTSGNDACAVGANTLSSSSHTAASGNHAFGYHCFHGLTTGGDGNIAIGRQAGSSQTTEDQSVYIGKSAGWATNAGQCVGIGRRALQGVSTGAGNTAVGFQTMYGSVGSGANNTMVGAYCGQTFTGSNNFGLGYQAAYSGSPGGAPASDNQGYLGDENITHIHAQVDIHAHSDKRDKNDVEPLTLGLEFVNQLEPVTYRWDKRVKYIKKYMLDLPKDDPDFVDLDDVVHDGTHTEPQLHAGLLAQDVEEIEQSYGFNKEDLTALVTDLSGDGKAYSLNYSRFVPMLIKSVQELSTQVESLKEEIEELKND